MCIQLEILDYQLILILMRHKRQELNIYIFYILSSLNSNKYLGLTLFITN